MSFHLAVMLQLLHIHFVQIVWKIVNSMKTSQSIQKISVALLTAQKEIGSAKKGSENPFFHSKYDDLGSVMETCKEKLNNNGILVLQPIDSDENGVYVETTLLHESGEWISASMRISPKSDTNPQDQGSAISYARRYSLQSMVFIPAEDDDAEKATHRTTSNTTQVNDVTGKCTMCGTTNEYHKKGCPNAE